MKLSPLRLIFALALMALLGVAVLSWAGYSAYQSNLRNRAAAPQILLAWARLAPFPSSAQHLSVTPPDFPFGNAIHATFVASPQDIDQWLKQSTGTREAPLSHPKPGIRYFDVKPGEGAAQAEVVVDDNKHEVSIYACSK